jgi:hypothetical protein
MTVLVLPPLCFFSQDFMLPLMTEPNLFQEVQEDLERQRLEGLWKQYGGWIVAVALLVVVATAGSTSYRSWRAEENQKLTTDLIAADKPQADNVKTIEKLQQFAALHPGTSHNDLALLKAASLAADQNDKVKARQLYDQVAQDTTADTAFRQLGDLLSVQLQMDDGDAGALTARLQPLTEENAPWRYTALEDQGYLALRQGDKSKARQIFTTLAQDARAPQSIGARATDILRSLN